VIRSFNGIINFEQRIVDGMNMMRGTRKIACAITAGIVLASVGQGAAVDIEPSEGLRVDERKLPLRSECHHCDPQDWSNATLRPRTYGATVTWRN
jgi:hypothetical protein